MSEVYEHFLDSISNTTDESVIGIILAQHKHIFAINSTNTTYKEFINLVAQHEQNEPLDTERIIIAIRKEFRHGTKNRNSQ